MSIILGAFSVRPFTKLYLPWMMISQWYRVNYPQALNQNCISGLNNGGAQFSLAEVPLRDIELGCNIDTIVVVTHLGLKLTNIAYPPQANFTAMSCELANKLQSFLKDILVPAVKAHFNLNPIAFLHKGAYSCRGQRSFTAIKSEHAFGEAIDFAGIILEDGRQFLVEDHYFENTEAGYFFKEIALLGCEYFGTNLGPEFDSLHKDHLHWALGFPRLCK